MTTAGSDRSTVAAATTVESVLVVAGGVSPEREVSLRSGRRVVQALGHVGVEARLADVDAALLPRLLDDPPAAVFLALHGAAGEDGALPAVLELCGVPYVGSSPQACRLAFDKPASKTIVAGVGLRTPDAVVLPHRALRDLGAARVLDQVRHQLGLPVVVKPVRGGSALGVTVVETAAELPHALVAAFAYGDEALLEAYVDGREVAVGVVADDDGPVALPPVEIVPETGRFDYAARYSAGATRYFAPARLPDPDTVRQAAVRAHQALGLGDVSRTDFVVPATGDPQLLEVNAAPGLTETSLLPLASEAAGMDFGELCRALLERAVARGPRTRTASRPG